MWHRTGAYYIPKLIFSYDFPIKVEDAYYIRVRIVFEFLRYLDVVFQVQLVKQKAETCNLLLITGTCNLLITGTSDDDRYDDDDFQSSK